jgi:hypothetical protein
LASGHGEASAQPGAQDQPERSEASTDKADRKKCTAPRRPMSFSSAVAVGQAEAPLK